MEIGTIDPDLLNIIINPENHYSSLLQFPFIMALHLAWKRQTNNDRITTLCIVAVADCLGPQRDDEENDDEYSRRCMKTRNQDSIAFRKRMDTTPMTTPESMTTTLYETTNNAWQNQLHENLSAIEIDRYENPGMHPSIIGDLWIVMSANCNVFFRGLMRCKKRPST